MPFDVTDPSSLNYISNFQRSRGDTKIRDIIPYYDATDLSSLELSQLTK